MFVKQPAVPHRHHRCHERSCSQCADDGTADSERDRKTSCVQKDARCSAFVPNARSLLTPDMGIERSYLSPAEPWRDESRDEMLRMTLRVDGKSDYTLVLPADEEYLDAVKAYLDIDVFADAILCDIRFKVPYIGDLIRDTDCPPWRITTILPKPWRTSGNRTVRS